MSNYAKKTDSDLKKELAQKRDDLRDFKFSIWGSKTRNTKEGKNIRKDIARILTEIKNRELNKTEEE